MRKVIEALPENPIDSDSDVEVEEIENSQGKVHQIGEQGQKDISSKVVVNSYQMSNSNLTHEMSSVCDSSSRIDCDSNTYSNSMTNTALTLLNSERSIIAFSSPAAEYFSSREFQGLLPIVPDGQDTAIQEGHFGIASTYRRYERIEKVTGADP